MKHIIISLIAVVISAMPAFAQKILSDDSSNGIRTIITSKENVKSGTDRVVVYTGLTMSQTPDTTIYTLDLKLSAMKHLAVSKGGSILLKDKDGNVITLASTQGSYGAEIKNVSGFSLYEINVDYPITLEQLNQLASGVTKVKIELDNDEPFEKEFKKDKIGKVLAKDISLIAGAMGSDKKASFYDDF